MIDVAEKGYDGAPIVGFRVRPSSKRTRSGGLIPHPRPFRTIRSDVKALIEPMEMMPGCCQPAILIAVRKIRA